MRNMQDGVLTVGDPQEIGNWAILARLGAGGMGVVYLGERNGTRAAIKTIRADLEVDPMFRKRFEREAAAVANAKSHRIARILESNLDTTPAYIAFEYYDGPNLREVVQQGGALGASALHALAIGLAEGLEAIHSEGVVHRDIKPSNVIMTARGPVIIDFGIAAYESSELTQLTATGEPIGSPTWMSPEYITTGRSAEPGDVFGWASTIQFAASGQPPFGIGATQPLLYRITNVEPAPHDIAGPLGRLVSQALAKRPENRPSTGDILEALLPGDAQTGSTPRLRLPLPAPITAGHQINIGSIPAPVPRVVDTVHLPPSPRPRLGTMGMRRGARTGLRAGAAGASVILVIVLLVFVLLGAVVLFARSERHLPDIPVDRAQPLEEVELAPVSAANVTHSQNEQDAIVIAEHLALVEVAFDKTGSPLADPLAINQVITSQLDRYLSTDMPHMLADETEVAGINTDAIYKRRSSFEAIRLYPDMVDLAVDAATGESPAGSTTTMVASTLTAMVERAMAETAYDGLGVVTPAVVALNRDLETLAAAGDSHLSDPYVQAAFGRFVLAAAEQIAATHR